MRLRSLIAAAGAGLLMGGTAPAAELYYQGFDYADEAAFEAAWPSTWGGTTNTEGANLQASSLEWAALPGTVGKAAGFGQQTEESSHQNVLSGLDNLTTSPRTLYLSFLIQPLSMNPTGGWGNQPIVVNLHDPVRGAEGFWAGLIQNSTGGEDFFALGVTPRDTAAYGALGVGVVPTSIVAPENNKTYLLLAKFEFSGADTVTGSLKVLTDPNAPLPTTDPTWDVTVTISDMIWPVNAGDYDINTIALHRDNTIQNAIFDEIRVGDTLDGALPVPEPGALGLLALGGMALLRRRRTV